MEMKNALERVGNLLAAHKDNGLKAPNIYVINHEIVLKQRSDLSNEAHLLLPLTYKHLRHGLSPEQWSIVQEALGWAMEKGWL